MRKLLLVLLPLLLFAFVEMDGNGEPDILPANEAFKVKSYLKDKDIVIDIKLGKDIYIYKKSLKIEQIEPEKMRIQPRLPKPEVLHGDEVFEKELVIKIPAKELTGSKIKLKVEFQGCSKAGICYPPQKKVFELNLENAEKKAEETGKKDMESEEGIVSMMKKENMAVILFTFFIFGLLLALTPCIFPMIPILSSLIVGSKNMTTKKAFLYSLVYVLAMALTYTVLGVLAGLFGSNLQAAFQNPVVIVMFSLIFVALAFSMFGFYEIGLPASLQTKLARKSDEAGSRGGIIGVAIMGFLSALIVGPCVAPPLAGALIYIGQTGDALLGGLALFVMSLGMGLPLLIIGTGAGKFMPKPGGWMEAVNKVFGVVMLGVAIWMLSRILPGSVTMLLWALLFIFSAVYLRAFESIKEGDHWFKYFKKALGITLFIYGLFLFFGSFTGATNPLEPLKVFNRPPSAGTSTQQHEVFKEIKNLKELDDVLKRHHIVLVDVTAKWCVSCKELEEYTFSDDRVRALLGKIAAYRYDVTDNSAEDKKFLKRFNLFGPPAILIFKDGKEVKRFIGFIDADRLVEELKEVM